MNNRREQLMLASAREYCKCVVEGKTIKYNQVLVEGNFPTTNSWYSNGLTANITNNVLTVTTTSAYQSVYNPNNLVEGHKYLFCLWARNLNGIPSFAFGWHSGYSTDIPITTNWQIYACVTPQIASGSDYCYIYPRGVGSAEFKQYQIIDLTELGLDNISSANEFFATDLGKYIRKGNYLEATSGAFIQAKTPINFKGVNIWNEQAIYGYYQISDGAHIWSGDTEMCTKDKIRVQPNKKYYVYCGKGNISNYAVFYDKNNNFVGYCAYVANSVDNCIKSPENAYYMNVTFGQDYGDTYNHDICISENVWDENWESGSFSDLTGLKIPYNGKIRNASLVPVTPGANFYFYCGNYSGLNIFFFGKNGYGNIVYPFNEQAGNKIIKIPSNCYYIGFSTFGTGTTNYDGTSIAIFYAGYQKYCGRTGKVFVIDYNQQIKNGNFATTDDWTSLNCNLSASNNELKCRTTGGTSVRKSITCVVNVVKEHKYLLLFKAKAPRNTYGYVTIGNSDSMGDYLMYDTYSQQNCIFTNPLLEGEQNLNIFIDYGQNTGWLTSGEDVYIKECLLIDLTALGMDNISTISDFNNTDLGQLIAEKRYLPYSQRNVGYALGKQLQKGDTYKTYSVDKVSYNQLVQNGNFQDTSNWLCENGTIQANSGSLTYEITAIASNFAGNRVEQAFSHTTGHKYLVLVDFLCPYDTILNIYVGDWVTLGTAQANTETTLVKICTAVSTGNNNLYFDIYGQPSYSVGDKITVYKYMKIDLTALGLDNITTIEEFYRTPLGMLIKKGFYLNYTISNKTIKPQLIRTMKEIDMSDLNWQSDEIGMYAPLPSDCKKFNGDEMANVLAEKYKTAPLYDYETDSIAIGDTSLGWVFLIRYNYDTPTGKLMYELNTPIIVDEDIEDIMVSRRTTNVESDNGVDLDFTKE